MSKFKETEFGVIPIDWHLKTIRELKADEKSAIAMGPFGSNIKAENFVSEGVPVIRGTNLNHDKYVDGDFVFLTEEKADELKGSNCTAGDLVFTHRGTIGQVGLIPEGKYSRYVISQSGMKLTVDKSKINCDFLFYFFKSKYGQYQLLKNEGQVGVPSISNPLSSLKEIEVPVPSLAEQNSVAETLSSIDRKIHLLHTQNRTLEKMSETLFKQWFLEEPNDGWIEKKLGELATITSSKRIFYSEYVNSGIPFYRSKEIIELRNTGSTKSELYISQERFNEINGTYGSPQEGDILMTSVGTLGVAYRVRKADRFYFKDGNLTWLKDFKKIPGSIIYLWLISRIGQGELESIKIGSTQEALTIEGLKNITFKIPPILRIKAYQPQFDDIINKIENNQDQIQILTQLRDTLMPKLVSGELRIIM